MIRIITSRMELLKLFECGEMVEFYAKDSTGNTVTRYATNVCIGS